MNNFTSQFKFLFVACKLPCNWEMGKERGMGGGVQLKSSSGGAEIVGKIESTPLFKVVLGI